MTDLTNVPGLPPMQNPIKPQHNIWPILAIIFGVLMVIFGILAIVGLVSYSSASQDASVYKAEGYKEGQAAQAKADESKIQSEKENPLRSYTAPDSAGAFSFKYPKNWSMYVDETSSGTMTITAHADIIKKLSGDNNYALEVKLTNTNYESQLKTYQSQVKSGKLKGRDVVVSGIQASRFEGQLDGKRTGTIVIIPVRDKMISFINSDKAYASQFDAVLASADINP